MQFWIFWVVLGVVFCFAEIIFPTAFIEFAMGLSALIVSLISLYTGNFLLQTVIWLALATTIAVASRKLMPRRRSHHLDDASEAETLTVILAGQKGRVLYEGNSWPACCDDPSLSIPVRQKVLVLRRQGNTLVVMPLTILDPTPESYPYPDPPQPHQPLGDS